MNHRPVRPPQRRTPADRRPGILPGRRFPLFAAVVAAGAIAPAPARADQPVVQATIYTGAQSPAPTLQSAMLSTLQGEGCPPYSGPLTLGLYPGGTSYTLPQDSTWTLSSVLTCALNVPTTNVTSVQVLNNSGYESPLSAADLTTASQFADPGAPGALPVVSNDGGEVQNTYTRPWRGGSDDNQADQVTESGPISIVVYENGTPLVVTISQQPGAQTASAETVTLSASVATAAGAPVSSSNLTYGWSFPDGSTSAAPTIAHSFVSGSSVVTLQVYDASTGTGGTATATVVYQPAPTQPGTTRKGTGQKKQGPTTGPTKAKKQKRSTTHTGTHTTTRTHATGTTTTRHATTRTGTTSARPTSTTVTTTHSAAPAMPTTTRAQTTAAHTTTRRSITASTTTARATHTTHTRTPAPPAVGRLVTGRLIADLTPVAADRSPLVHRVGATPTAAITPQAAQQGLDDSTPPATAIVGGAAVLALLGLGAARELRGRRTRSLHG